MSWHSILLLCALAIPLNGQRNVCVRVRYEGETVVVEERVFNGTNKKGSATSGCQNKLSQAIREDTKTLTFEIEEFQFQEKLTLERSITIDSKKVGSQKTRLKCHSNEGMFKIAKKDEENVTVLFKDLEICGCQANDNEGLIHVGAGTNVVFDNVKLTENNNTRKNSALVLVEADAKLTIKNKSEFSNNERRVILVGNNTKVKISNSLFSNNTSPSNGTVLATQETAINVDIEISEQSNFSFNKVKKGSGSVLWLHSTNLNITNGAQFTSNEAEYMGGAIFMEGDLNATIVDARFMNNSCLLGPGGGISIWPTTNISTCDISRSIFVGNHAHGFMGSGGAIAFSGTVNDTHKHGNGAKLLLANDVLFSKNSARMHGGAVYVHRKYAFLNSSSILVRNSVLTSGGALGILTSEFVGVQDSSIMAHVKDSYFSSNNAPHRGGGAISATGSVRVTVAATCFLNNSGKNGGAIFLFYDVNITIDGSSRFSKNRAINVGGAISLERGGRLAIKKCILKRNRGTRGGSVCTYEAKKFEAVESVFKFNTANRSGGAVEIENPLEIRGKETVARIESSKFFSNKAPRAECQSEEDGYGGAIKLTKAGVQAEIKDCTLKANQGRWGGAICSDEAFSLDIKNSVFQRNQAILGGVSYLIPLNKQLDSEQDYALIENCTFQENQAETGGVIYSRSSLLNFEIIPLLSSFTFTIKESWFENNIAGHRAGVFYSLGIQTRLDDCQFRTNRASKSSWTAERFTCSRSGEAANNRNIPKSLQSSHHMEKGGAVFIENSLFNCNNCTFEKNRAMKGGGIYSIVSERQLRLEKQPYLQCRDCKFNSNVAEEAGGALFISIPSEKLISDLEKHRVPVQTKKENLVLNSCSNRTVSGFVCLHRPMFMSNKAKEEEGHIIFTNNPRQVFIYNQRRLQNLVDFVKSNSSSNIQDVDYASIPMMVNLSRTCLENLNRGNTGANFADLNFTVVDYFDKQNDYIKVEIDIKACQNNKSCCDSENTQNKTFVLYGQLRRVTLNGNVNFSGLDVTDRDTGHQKHTLWACFTDLADDPAILEPQSFTVQFRSCYTMERYDNKSDRKSCFRCDPGNYFPKNTMTCETCPKHARCENLTIVPKSGYWHEQSISGEILPCRLRAACQHDPEDLRKVAYEFHMNKLFLSYSDPHYNQCKKGYQGPVCGSCQANYGRWNNICVVCTEAAYTWFSLVAAFLWNLLILLIFLYSAKSITGRIQFNELVRSRTVNSTDPNRTQANRIVNVELATFSPEAMYCGPDTPSTVTTPSTTIGMPPAAPTQIRSSHRWRRLQETAAVDELPLANPLSEAFKIILNFAQVIYLASLVSEDIPNVLKWPATLFEALNFTDTVFLLVECLLPENSSKTMIRMVLQLLFPIGLFALISIVTVYLAHSKKPLKYALCCVTAATIFYCRFHSRFSIGLTALCTIYLYFTPEVRTLLKFLDKESISFDDPDIESQRWAVDTSVVYFGTSHAFVVGFLVIPLLAALTVAFPLLLFVALTKNKDSMHEEEVVATYGFLYKGYKPACYYWETVIIIRKTIIAIISVFFQNPELKAIFISMTLVVFLCLQLNVCPFISRFPGLNHLEGLSLGISTLIFLGVAVVARSADLNKGLLRHMIAWALFFVLVFAIIAMGTALYLACHDFLNDKLIEISVYSNKEEVAPLPLRKKLYHLVLFYIQKLNILALLLRKER